jgi:hypothetical protein
MNASEPSRPLPARIIAAITVCNPLLLLSPLCLLYGIYRAVVAPNLFPTDTGNTVFNFLALATYVLMVCVTSTLLARKRIVPDTVMLLLVNALLFVAPFILIAHGVFLEGHVAIALGALGIAMAKGQLEIFRRRLPDSFVTPQLMIGAALILATNFAAPLVFRHGLENATNDNEVWGRTSAYAWHLILPLLVAWLNVIPLRRNSDQVWSRPWFAPLLYLLWLAGTSIQLWTVAYVDDRHLYPYQFAVAVWVLTWTAFNRGRIFEAVWATRLEKFGPVLAILIPGIAALNGLDLQIASALYLLNLPLLVLARTKVPAIAFAGVSLVGMLCCMPLNWITELSPLLNRGEFIALVLGAVTLGGVGMIRDARAGFLAALGVGLFAHACDLSITLALNAAILFLYIHQLRWKTISRDEHVLLALAGFIWIAHTIGLELRGSTDIRVACLVATIVVTICLRNAALGLPTSLAPAICSIIVLCVHPLHWSTNTVTTAPSGALAIFIGFALLAIGAWDSARRKGLTARAHMQQTNADANTNDSGDLPV